MECVIYAHGHFAGIKKSTAAFVTALKKYTPTIRLIDHGDTTISNQAAYFVVVDYTQSAAGIDVFVRQIQFITGKDGLNYTIAMRDSPEAWASQSKLFTILATRFVLLPPR